MLGRGSGTIILTTSRVVKVHSKPYYPTRRIHHHGAGLDSTKILGKHHGVVPHRYTTKIQRAPVDYAAKRSSLTIEGHELKHLLGRRILTVAQLPSRGHFCVGDVAIGQTIEVVRGETNRSSNLVVAATGQLSKTDPEQTCLDLVKIERISLPSFRA